MVINNFIQSRLIIATNTPSFIGWICLNDVGLYLQTMSNTYLQMKLLHFLLLFSLFCIFVRNCFLLLEFKSVVTMALEGTLKTAWLLAIHHLRYRFSAQHSQDSNSNIQLKGYPKRKRLHQRINVKYLNNKNIDFNKNSIDFLLKIPDSSSFVSSLFDHNSRTKKPFSISGFVHI